MSDGHDPAPSRHGGPACHVRYSRWRHSRDALTRPSYSDPNDPPSGERAPPSSDGIERLYLGSFPGFGSSIGNACAPAAGAARIGAGASLCTPFAGCETGADAVVVFAAVCAPVLELMAVMNRRAESSLLRTFPEMMSDARISGFP